MTTTRPQYNPSPTPLHPAPVHVNHFVWHNPTATFTAEISDLGKDFRFERVWPDACDEGLTLYSRRLGREPIVFAVDDYERDADGDLVAWHLIPVGKGAAAVGFTLTIFND